MCCLSILGVDRVRGLGLLVVRVAKLVVVALVVVGIDEIIREEGVVHGVFHCARRSPHARGTGCMPIAALGLGLSHETGVSTEGDANTGQKRVA